jgi:hypothetical protein
LQRKSFSRCCRRSLGNWCWRLSRQVYAGSDLLSALTSVIAGKRFVSRALVGQAFAETSDSGLVRDQGHVVQFYTDDAVLLDELAALFRGSLGEGRAVAAIMTSSHRSGLERRLLAQGVDVGEATQNGRLCMLDADQALNEFMEPAGPSRERFLSQFGKSYYCGERQWGCCIR